MAKIEWEEIVHNRFEPQFKLPHFALIRSKVPGGWLVAFYGDNTDAGYGGLTFVPDPNHRWDGNSLP